MRRSAEPAGLDFNVAAIIFACAAIIIPYLLPVDYSPFYVPHVLSGWEHLLLSVPLCALIVISFLLGRRAGAASPVDDRELLPFMPLVPLRALLLFSFAFQAVYVLTAGAAYLGQGFIGARTAVDIQGIGVIFRIYTVPLVLLAAGGERRPLLFLYLFIEGLLIVGRALAISERTALIEFLITAIVTLRWANVRFKPWHYLLIGSLLVPAFGFIQSTRLSQQSDANLAYIQGNVDAVLTTLSTYYGDTQNKAYLVWHGMVSYPYLFALDPLYALLDERQDFQIFLGDQRLGGMGYINPALNNPGGLAQDFSDFGIVAGLAWCAIKFALCGYVLKRARYVITLMPVEPIFILQVLEYPRFNHIETAFVFYGLLSALTIGWFVRRMAMDNYMRHDMGHSPPLAPSPDFVSVEAAERERLA